MDLLLLLHVHVAEQQALKSRHSHHIADSAMCDQPTICPEIRKWGESNLTDVFIVICAECFVEQFEKEFIINSLVVGRFCEVFYESQKTWYKESRNSIIYWSQSRSTVHDKVQIFLWFCFLSPLTWFPLKANAHLLYLHTYITLNRRNITVDEENLTMINI